MIPNLPFEIIEHIDHYLTHQDRFQLIQVNPIWYQAFILLLYRTISITTYTQFQQLIQIFQQQSTTTRAPLGKYVHQFNILLDQLEEKELRTIQQLCPFVQSIHVDWRIWNYLAAAPQEKRNYHIRLTLPPITKEFLSVYGGCKLSSLTLDLYKIDQVDGIDMLCYTPNLRNLTLMGINQQHDAAVISTDFVESIHQCCPFLENITLEGYKADAYHQVLDQFSKKKEGQFKRIKSFSLMCQIGADRYQDWLPYFSKRYPNMETFCFNHAGDGKDIIEPCPIEVYTEFIKACPKLKEVRWYHSAPDFQFFQQLAKHQQQKLTQLHIYDNIAVPSLLTTALFDNNLKDVTQLTFGPVPHDVIPHSLIQSIAQACPQLLHLSLKEPHCNLTSPFKVDSILNHCQKLVSLTLDHVALRVSFQQQQAVTQHPLKKLTMRHCSSFDGVFDYISPRCLSLEELILIAYTQRDRRYKVQVPMPHQRFKKVQLCGLRTETYDAERRIRFFSVNITNKQQEEWYFMNQFNTETTTINYNYNNNNDTLSYKREETTTIETAKEFTKLSEKEVDLLHSLLEKPLPWSEVENRKLAFLAESEENKTCVLDWYPKDIYDAGYVDLACQSVNQIYINNKKLIL